VDGESAQAEAVVFGLRGKRGALSLQNQGIEYPSAGFRKRTTFTPYSEITHLLYSQRGLRLGTRRSVYVFLRGQFVDSGAPEALARALLERIAAQPDGVLQLSRMAELDRRARSARRPRVCTLLTLFCVILFLLEHLAGLPITSVGFFGRTLFDAGEVWRLVTANFLHANFFHLALNGLGLLSIGVLVEQPLGALRAVFVLGASAVGAMGVGALLGYEQAVGASGLVSGLAGAAFWLEMRHPQELPLFWRIPRRVFLVALAGDGLLSLLVPVIAGGAHAGGFVAGLGATALVARGGLAQERARPWLRLAVTTVGVGTLLAFVASAQQLRRPSDFLVLRAERLLDRDDVSPLLLNNMAWFLATDPRGRSAQRAELAVRLAERAVQITDHSDPNILDTLAEAQFAAGSKEEAIASIDEAIRLSPEVPYFQEQRRRFTGERATEDRPITPPGAPEGSPPWRRPPPAPDREDPDAPAFSI